MKRTIYILIIEDELDVMEALVNDLAFFESSFPIETANSAKEAENIISEIYSRNEEIGLILCDHILPGKNGIDFLIDLYSKEDPIKSKKVLVTGQAGLEDTIQAINKANLDHYIAKPWSLEGLQAVVASELTNYVIAQNINPLSYMNVLDAEQISEFLRHNPLTDN